MTSAQGEQHHGITDQSYDVEWLPGLFPLPQLSDHEAGYQVGNGQFQSAIAKLLEKVDGTAACKQGGRFLRPVDLQVVTCFLQGKQNFIQL